MRKQLTTLCAAIFVLSACGVLAAQSQQPASENFQWSGELVSFDSATRTLTIKARLAYDDAMADLKTFKAGDRVLLWWSGYDAYADGIRKVMPYTDDRKATDRFLMPAELVSTEAPHQYVTFRVTVPESSATALNPVRPGEWVSVTSAHRPSGASDAVVAAKPYVDAAGSRSSN